MRCLAAPLRLAGSRPRWVLPHEDACTPPNALVRLLPFVGDAMFSEGFKAYEACMTSLLWRLRLIRACVMGVVGIVAAAAVVVWLTRLRQRDRKRHEKRQKVEQGKGRQGKGLDKAKYED